jgi:hypothetical protein
MTKTTATATMGMPGMMGITGTMPRMIYHQQQQGAVATAVAMSSHHHHHHRLMTVNMASLTHRLHI